MKLFFRSFSFALLFVFSQYASAIDISENMSVNFVTEANYYPFEYVDESSQMQGFDIDIAIAVCRVANLTCKFHNQTFDSLLLSLQFGRFDAAIAALDITAERKEKVDFSNSYYKSAPVFLSAIKLTEAFSISGKFIGVQSNSSNHDYLIKHAKKDSFIIAYPSSSNAFLDLSEGKIDLVFADRAVADDFLLHNKNSDKFSVTQTETVFFDTFSEGYGIAVKQGNKVLLDRLNYGLAKIQKQGIYQQIFNRYFSE